MVFFCTPSLVFGLIYRYIDSRAHSPIKPSCVLDLTAHAEIKLLISDKAELSIINEGCLRKDQFKVTKVLDDLSQYSLSISYYGGGKYSNSTTKAELRDDEGMQKVNSEMAEKKGDTI